MYQQKQYNKQYIDVNNAKSGETIEQRIRRLTTTGEGIKEAGSLIYTERKDGVVPDYNIREDKWEHAVEAQDRAARMTIAHRGLGETPGAADKEAEGDGGAGSTDATN